MAIVYLVPRASEIARRKPSRDGVFIVSAYRCDGGCIRSAKCVNITVRVTVGEQCCGHVEWIWIGFCDVNEVDGIFGHVNMISLWRAFSDVFTILTSSLLVHGCLPALFLPVMFLPYDIRVSCGGEHGYSSVPNL